MYVFSYYFAPEYCKSNIEPSKGLKGVADFLISNNPNAQELESPIMCVSEAKTMPLKIDMGNVGQKCMLQGFLMKELTIILK